MNRRDFLKLAGVGAAALTIPYSLINRKRKKKMTIEFDTPSTSGYVTGADEYQWDHPTFATEILRPGVVVGVSIFGAGVVQYVNWSNQQLVFAYEKTNGNYRSEIWHLPGIVYEGVSSIITVKLSATLPMVAGTATYKYFGGIGARNGVASTGNPASVTILPTQINSMMLANLCAEPISGIGNAVNQNNLWDVPNASGTGMGSDKGPIPTLISTTIQYDGIGAAQVWAISAVELLSYQDNPPAIMGM